MRLNHLLPVLILVSVLARGAAAQQAAGGVRLIRAWTEPASPGFGEPGTVRLELRAAPGVALFMPDTLSGAAHMSSAGTGRWEITSAPGDSVLVSAHYPIVGFRAGIQELPKLQVAIAARQSLADPPLVLPMREAAAAAGADVPRVEVPLGSTTIAEYAPLEAADSAGILTPRPPADVLGGEWSVWLVLAVGLASLAGAGGLGALLPRWWAQRGAAIVARIRGRSPKQEALRELERIRGYGWHLDGRVDDFYASSTEILRGFAGRLDPQWTGALTTGELLERLETRSDSGGLEPLAAAISNAERAKFGTLRPASDSAEADWTAIRDWVRRAPVP